MVAEYGPSEEKVKGSGIFCNDLNDVLDRVSGGSELLLVDLNAWTGD